MAHLAAWPRPPGSPCGRDVPGEGTSTGCRAPGGSIIMSPKPQLRHHTKSKHSAGLLRCEILPPTSSDTKWPLGARSGGNGIGSTHWPFLETQEPEPFLPPRFVRSAESMNLGCRCRRNHEPFILSLKLAAFTFRGIFNRTSRGTNIGDYFLSVGLDV